MPENKGFNKALVSIIIPVFNGEKYLSQAIESCLNQTYQRIEVIIVDDYSTDDSMKIARIFEKKDNRIRILKNTSNIKLPAALNIGHRLAKGAYLTWTSDDNILKPFFVEHFLEEIIRSKSDLVYSDFDIINDNGQLIRNHISGPTEHILFGNVIGASFLYKKEVFMRLNGYDESLFLLEDYDFWLRASVKFNFHHLNESLYQYRLHSDSLTSDIHFNNSKKIKHKQGAIKMFRKIADEFSWNNSTLNFLTNSFLGHKIDISKYLKEKKVIKKDILKFNSKDFDDNKVIFGLQFLLRNQLTANNCNFKTLVEVLKRDRKLLFHTSFSKKTTFYYILNSLFH